MFGCLGLLLACDAKSDETQKEPASAGANDEGTSDGSEAPEVPGVEPAPLPAPPASGLNGRVTTRNQAAGVPAARVCAWPTMTGIWGTRDQVDTATCVDAGPRGGFALDLEQGAYWVVAIAEGYRASVEPLDLRSAAPGAQLTIDLDEGGDRVEGQVVDLRGLPVAGAKVRGFTSHGLMSIVDAQVETDADGRFSMWSTGAGSPNVVADGFARTVRIGTGPEGKAWEQVTIVPEARIEGVVVDAKGKPVPGARVAAPDFMGAATGAPWDAVRADAEGKFVLDGLAPGEYPLIAMSPTGGGALKEPIELGLGQVRTGVTLELTKELRYVNLRTVDEKGEPVPRCMVRLQPDKYSIGQWFRMDHEGRGQMPAAPGKWLVGGISCEGWLGMPPYDTIAIVEGEPLPAVALKIRRGPALRGRIVDADGKPLAGLRVRAAWDSDKEDDTSQAARQFIDFAQNFAEPTVGETDEKGDFAIEGLAAGLYELHVGPYGDMPGGRPKITMLTAGIDKQTHRMPRTGKARVKVTGIEDGELLTALSCDDAPRFGAVAKVEGGQAEFEVLPPGALTVGELGAIGCYGDRKRGQSFQVTAGEVTEVTVEAAKEAEAAGPRRLKVQVLDPEGKPAAGAVLHVPTYYADRDGPPRLQWRSVQFSELAVTGPDGTAEVSTRADGLEVPVVLGARVGEIGITTLKRGSDEPTVLKLVKSGG